MENTTTYPPTVIYHSADYDGIFCREIARKFLPNASLIGWNFGDPKVRMPSEGPVYILDLSPECLAHGPGDLDQVTWGDLDRVTWIDHHKTAIEKWPNEILGYRIDGVAACRLAWQWFAIPMADHFEELPTICDFKNRIVEEPLSVRLAGEYDIWDKRDPDAEIFQYGLRAVDEGADFWEALLRTDEVGGNAVDDLLEHGYVCQKYARKVDAETCKARSFLLKWEGLTFLCINSARFNSLFFAALDNPTNGHDALAGFCWNGKCWTVSLYHAKHRTDLDLSEIAKRQGGGGHRGACGFTCQTLPFTL